eukprot:Polyplicarium_translucidae@DN459_c0_g1_i1.p1
MLKVLQSFTHFLPQAVGDELEFLGQAHHLHVCVPNSVFSSDDCAIAHFGAAGARAAGWKRGAMKPAHASKPSQKWSVVFASQTGMLSWLLLAIGTASAVTLHVRQYPVEISPIVAAGKSDLDPENVETHLRSLESKLDVRNMASPPC